MNIEDTLQDLQNQISDLKYQLDGVRKIEIGGVWKNWMPTVTAMSGTFTTVSAYGSYSAIGNVVAIIIGITITTNGTAAGSVKATLPFTTNLPTILAGRENVATGNILQGYVAPSGNTVTIYTYNNLYPGGDGRVLYLSGFISVG
jgi:hypothetical protein